MKNEYFTVLFVYLTHCKSCSAAPTDPEWPFSGLQDSHAYCSKSREAKSSSVASLKCPSTRRIPTSDESKIGYSSYLQLDEPFERTFEAADTSKTLDPWSLEDFDPDMDMNLDGIFASLDASASSGDGQVTGNASIEQKVDPAEEATVRNTPLDSEYSQIRPKRARRRGDRHISLEEVKSIILPQWSALQAEICRDPIALAEAVEDMGVDHVHQDVINAAMADILTKSCYTRHFIELFESRRYYIDDTIIHMSSLEKSQARFSLDTKKRTLHVIRLMIRRGVVLDGNVRELEMTTRDLYREIGSYHNKTWYNAILYYLLQQRGRKEAALFRRLRRDYENSLHG